MRITVFVALALVAGCAEEKLAVAPPSGIDFSGTWQLNEADSDDPLHLLQSQNSVPTGSASAPAPSGGGRRRQGGGGGGGGGFDTTATAGPVMPAVGALGEGLRWPGKQLVVKQTAGIVTMSSAGIDRVYRPTAGPLKTPHHHRKPADDGEPRRDMPARDWGGPPAVCGWDDKTLVIRASEPDEGQPPSEDRFGLSDDGQRLIEVVGFKGGRSGGFTMSRVWDRVVPAAMSGSGSAEKSRALPGS
jgi:hypothetical protein